MTKAMKKQGLNISQQVLPFWMTLVQQTLHSHQLKIQVKTQASTAKVKKHNMSSFVPRFVFQVSKGPKSEDLDDSSCYVFDLWTQLGNKPAVLFICCIMFLSYWIFEEPDTCRQGSVVSYDGQVLDKNGAKASSPSLGHQNMKKLLVRAKFHFSIIFLSKWPRGNRFSWKCEETTVDMGQGNPVGLAKLFLCRHSETRVPLFRAGFSMSGLIHSK